MVHEGFAAPARIAQLLVELLGFPARGNQRLLLGEAGFHGELSLRQEDGVSIVALFGHGRRALAGGAGNRKSSPKGEDQSRALRRRSSASWVSFSSRALRLLKPVRTAGPTDQISSTQR